MVKNIEVLIENGCNDNFIKIIKKYNNLSTSIDDLEKFIYEIEAYKLDEKIHPFEEDILETANKIYLSLKSEVLMSNDTSTEDAIRRNEIDYNGDTFTADGYELNTDDGRRY